MRMVKEFYKHFTYRGYPVEIKEVELPLPHSPQHQHQQNQKRKRCFIDHQDATDRMEPGAPGKASLEDWEAAARSYIDAVMASVHAVRTRQV